LCPRCLYKLCYNHSSSSNRATALAMLDVVTPTCRAISAIDNPNSSTPRFAILARTVLTFLRRLPPLSSFALLRPFLHSSSIILVRVLSVRRSFSCRLVFSSASLRMALTKSPLPRMRSSDSSFWPLLRACRRERPSGLDAAWGDSIRCLGDCQVLCNPGHNVPNATELAVRIDIRASKTNGFGLLKFCCLSSNMISMAL